MYTFTEEFFNGKLHFLCSAFFTKIKTYEKTYAATEEFRFNVLLATWK